MRVNMQHQVALGLNTLSSDQIEDLHFATLETLERVGVDVYEGEALDLLKKKGAKVDNSRVKIPTWMVQDALASVPCRVVLSNRLGERTMFLEKNRNYYGTGSDTPYTIDIYSRQRRVAVKQDVINSARITDSLANIDFVMSMALASDVSNMHSYIHQFEAMVFNTVKPICYTAQGLQDLKIIVEMAEVIAGGENALARNPFLVLYDEPSSPLQHSKEAVQKLIYLAKKGLPVIYEPAIMLGGTGPVTSAGAIVVANSEILSGLVVHQLANEGAPFVYGGTGSPLDMKTMICAYGSCEEALNCAAMSGMANYYNLPIFTTAGCSDAIEFDQQAGAEATFNLLINSLAGANLIHDLGYIESGMTSSMEMLLLCNEIVGMVKHTLRGIEVNSNTVSMDLIEKVGPGGNYFAEEHTFNNFKEHLYIPELWNRSEHSRWKGQGSPTLSERINQKVRELLENHQIPELPLQVVNRIKDLSGSRV